MQEARLNVGRELLCFSHLRWNFVYQRPQHLLSRAARDFRVRFFEEPRYEKIDAPRLDISSGAPNVEVVVPVLSEDADPAARDSMVRRLLDSYLDDSCRPVDVAWYYTPMALRYSSHLSFPVCVYDCMDELAQFKGAPPELQVLERSLMRRADVVFTGGLSLYEAKRRLHPNVHAFPSSVDVAHFLPARARSSAEPGDLAALARPRIGYFGVIDERLDTDLVAHVAELRPDWQFVMIGPVVKIDPAVLPRRPNIHWLGGKAYAELPSYLAGLDIGFMPFAINAATRFISPTKTPEFLAAGLPVVSTPIVDVCQTWGAWNLVEIATDANEMAGCIETLLSRQRVNGTSDWLSSVDRRLRATSWDSTWSGMLARVQQCSHPTRREPRIERVQVSHV